MLPIHTPHPTPPAREAVCADTFRQYQSLLRERIGIFLGVKKMQLLTSRLARRLRVRGCPDYESYLELVLADRDGTGEFQEMVNRITTNKTDFFRESHHFRALTDLLQDIARRCGRPPRIWSAGCSTGEEPWSIAMVLAATLPASMCREPLVWATDIDTHVLRRAAEGVYPIGKIDAVDDASWKPWFLRGTGPSAGLVRVKRELRQLVCFEQQNLVGDADPRQGGFDAVFCRNTLIYFDRPTQARVVERLTAAIRPEGRLFLGHSEALLGDVAGLVPEGQTTFRRIGSAAPAAEAPSLPERPFEARVVAGGMFCSARPAVVRTLLGSCVAACLYDPVAKIGGMNHFLLPEGHLDVRDRALAYGVHAMEMLVNEIMRQGGERRRIRAKVFGAASVLTDFTGGRRVAERNQEFVRRYLDAEGIPLVAHKLGGDRPLDVRFETHTGRAFIRAAGIKRQRTTASREAQYFRQVSAHAAADRGHEATLFEDDHD